MEYFTQGAVAAMAVQTKARIQKLRSPSTENPRTKTTAAPTRFDWQVIFVKCSAEWALSTKDNKKTDRTYRKCRSHEELHTAHHSCYSLLCTLNLLSLKNLWLYFSPRGLLRSWLPPWYDRWSYVPLTPEAVGLCQWKAPQGEQDQPRGSDDSHWLPRPEASSKTCKQPGSVCLK